MAVEFGLDFKVLEHLRGYPDELRRYSNLIKQAHPRGTSAVEFLLKRPAASDDFVYALCRLIHDGEAILSAVEASELSGTPPKVFLEQIASRADFPPPLFRHEHRAVWRRSEIERYFQSLPSPVPAPSVGSNHSSETGEPEPSGGN